MSLLNLNFVMIYINHEMLVLLKSQLNSLKDNIFEYFFKEHNRLFLKNFSQYIMMENLSLEEANRIKDIRKFFRLKKELNYAASKNIKIKRSL